MAITLIQYQGGCLSFELGGKRTSLLAHQTPLYGDYSRLNGCPGSLSHYKHAKVINSAGSDLLSLINDILDIAKVEEGKMQLVIEPLVTVDLAEHLRRNFEHLAQHRGLEFHVDVAPNTPTPLFTDRQRLEQVLRNFFSNAFKFTHQGSVSLHIGPAPEGIRFKRIQASQGPVIALSVSDTGIGVAADKQDLIFEAFQQADGTTSRKYGGTGLGRRFRVSFRSY